MGTVFIAFIAFIACDIALIAFAPFIACDNAGGAILGIVFIQTISNHGCSTMFILVNVAGEAADEAEEEASTVLPRRFIVLDANWPPPPLPWADTAAGSRGKGGGGGGRDAKGMTWGNAHNGAEGGCKSEEEEKHATRRETV